MAKATSVYARQHSRGLTVPQQSAVDLLAVGKSDTEAAELLGLHRTTLSKWRAYDPVFQAALNQRRAEVWAVGIDKLRALIPKALDALADELGRADNPNRGRVALDLLKLAGNAEMSKIGPTEAGKIVEEMTRARRNAARTPLDDLADEARGLPNFAESVAQVWQELDALADGQPIQT